MEWLVLFVVVVFVTVVLTAPAWRRDLATRAEALHGRARRSIGRWQARDMQRAAVRVVGREAMVSLTGAYLWDRVCVALAPEDHARIAPFINEFVADIEGLIRQLAERPPARAEVTRYRLVAAPEVTVVCDGSVLPGTQKVSGYVSGHRARGRGDGSSGATRPATRRAAPTTSRMKSPMLWVDGRSVALCDGMVVGRGDDADIRLSDPRVSRRHARIAVAGEEVRVEDLASANGTRINGTSAHGSVLLSNGDRVSFGGTQAGRFAYDEATQLVA